MKQKITLTFDCDVPEQAIVYEYIKNKGRSKTKAVTDVLLKEAEKENTFLLMKEQLIQAVLGDERICLILEKQKNVVDTFVEKDEKKTTLTKPKVVHQKTEEKLEKSDDVEETDIDYETIMKGLEAFGI